MERFFTSDTHAWHERIISLSNRPFSNVLEMNKVMADNINSIVPRTARLYHLGDFSYGTRQQIIEFREMINCIDIVLILGNHDSSIKKSKNLRDKLFTKVVSDEFIKIGVFNVHMYHYPIAEWNKWHDDGWHLHGHTHNEPIARNYYVDYTRRSLNVGVDVNEFKPISEQYIYDTLTSRGKSVY